jgi:PRELI-like family
MVLLDTLLHIFQHNWTDVATASWRKYPCADRPDVRAVDIVSRRIDPETGALHSLRVVQTELTAVPGWLRTFLGADMTYALEESVVDPVTRTMVLRTHNLSYRSLMDVEETCTYTVNAENSAHTDFQQDVSVRAFPFGIAGRMEHWSVDRFKQNAMKGRSVMEQAVELVKHEAGDLLLHTEDLLQQTGELVNELTDQLVSAAHDSLVVTTDATGLDECPSSSSSAVSSSSSFESSSR